MSSVSDDGRDHPPPSSSSASSFSSKSLTVRQIRLEQSPELQQHGTMTMTTTTVMTITPQASAATATATATATSTSTVLSGGKRRWGCRKTKEDSWDKGMAAASSQGSSASYKRAKQTSTIAKPSDWTVMQTLVRVPMLGSMTPPPPSSSSSSLSSSQDDPGFCQQQQQQEGARLTKVITPSPSCLSMTMAGGCSSGSVSCSDSRVGAGHPTAISRQSSPTTVGCDDASSSFHDSASLNVEMEATTAIKSCTSTNTREAISKDDNSLIPPAYSRPPTRRQNEPCNTITPLLVPDAGRNDNKYSLVKDLKVLISSLCKARIVMARFTPTETTTVDDSRLQRHHPASLHTKKLSIVDENSSNINDMDDIHRHRAQPDATVGAKWHPIVVALLSKVREDSSSLWRFLRPKEQQHPQEVKAVESSTLSLSSLQTRKWQHGPSLVQDLVLLSMVLLIMLTIGQVSNIWTQLQSKLEIDNQDCIYVTGGGFSGFWFSLGRLHTLDRNAMKRQNFVCYSAGCLGVVSVYANYSMPDLYDRARSIQDNWNDGALHRYHIVEDFVDGLLEGQDFDDDVLSSLFILTSVPVSPIGFEAKMQSPTSMAELKTLLLQTTWIPLAVGSAYTYQGHMDGAFSIFQHPTCQHQVGLATDWQLLTNTLNVNLGKEMVGHFWNMGLEFGI